MLSSPKATRCPSSKRLHDCLQRLKYRWGFSNFSDMQVLEGVVVYQWQKPRDVEVRWCV
jgi:hypothetical protein